MRKIEHIWAVWFGNHIHTDCEQKLAVFRTKKIAKKWMQKNGIDGCRVEKLPLQSHHWES